MASEIWRPCPDYERVYAVSNLGRVMRVARGKGTRPGRVLKLHANSMGYLRAQLATEGKSHLKLVHVMVCEAFHGPRPTPQHGALHRNGRHTDNRDVNLRWGTQRENMADKNEHGTHNKGSAHCLAKLDEGRVAEIKRMLSAQVSQYVIAEQFGVHRSTINNIALGKNWTHV